MRNPENNYRYYSTAQLPALNFVTTLSELEIPLKTIAELRKERDPEELLELLEKQEHQMDMEMRSLRMRYSIIHARRELMKLGMRINGDEVSVIHLEEKAMTLWPRNEYREGDTFLEPLAAQIAQTGEYHINLSFPVGGYHDSLESLINAPGRPDHFISFDPIGTLTRPGGDYLVGYARGYYGDIGDLPERMQAYAKENSINTTGPVYTLYLHEEISTKNPTDYLAQCSVAISKKRAKQQQPTP
jgi:DNA-binding transcriptional MerR regulator